MKVDGIRKVANLNNKKLDFHKKKNFNNYVNVVKDSSKKNNNQNIAFGGIGMLIISLVDLIIEYPVILPIATWITSAGALAICIANTTYKSNIDEKNRKKTEEEVKKQEQENIKKLSQKMKISIKDAQKYHDNFLSIAMIKPTNNGHEKGINAIMGYGIEKYNLAMDFLTPIISAQNTQDEQAKKVVPNGLLLYGPGGSGKTYIMDNLCDHLREFGVEVKEIIFDENHEKNANNIRKAFIEAEENFKNTGKYTIIKFPEDIDNKFTKRNISTNYLEEMGSFLYKADNCASRGAIWIGTANFPQQIDKSVLRRASLKMPIGNMQDFEIGDMIKYSILNFKDKKTADNFNYQKVVDCAREIKQDFTPYEYKTFVQNTLNSYGTITADKVIEKIKETMDNKFATLDEDTKNQFKNDQEYIKMIDENNKDY